MAKYVSREQVVKAWGVMCKANGIDPVPPTPEFIQPADFDATKRATQTFFRLLDRYNLQLAYNGYNWSTHTFDA